MNRGRPVFRPFNRDDLPELESMVLALYTEDTGGEPMSPKKVRRTVDEFDRHPGKGRIVIFTHDQTVVGYAIVVYCWSNEHGGDIVTIDEIFVKPQWRGRGIGTAFLNSSAFGGDAVGLRLEVTPTNQRALGYYLRQGFAPEANQRMFRWIGR